MKKLNLVIALLLIASVSTFAVDVVPSAELSGDASFTFGVDLDNSVTGIANDSSSDLKITFVEEATEEKGEGEVVGWIELADFEAYFNDEDGLSVTVPDVSAKLLLGPLYIDVLGVDNEIDVASVGQSLNPGPVLGSPALNTSFGNDPAEEHQGVAIGGDFGVFAFDLGISSQFDWTTDSTTGETEYVDPGSTVSSGTSVFDYDTQTILTSGTVGSLGGVQITTTTDAVNTANNYTIFADTTISPADIIEVGVGFHYEAADAAINGNSIVGIGADVDFSLPLGDMTFDLEIGSDILMFNSSGYDTTNIEIGVGTGLGFAGDALDDTEYFGLDDDDEIDINPGIYVGFGVGLGSSTLDSNNSITTTVGDLNVTFFDGDLIDMLEVVAIYELNGLMNTTVTKVSGSDTTTTTDMTMAGGVRVSADLDVVSPYAEFYAAENSTSNLIVGVDINVIDNTTFTVEYDSNDLMQSTDPIGVLTFATKIEF